MKISRTTINNHIVNGTVQTLDSKQPVAEKVIVQAGRIAYWCQNTGKIT